MRSIFYFTTRPLASASIREPFSTMNKQMWDLLAIVTFQSLTLTGLKKKAFSSYSLINEIYELERTHYILQMSSLQHWSLTVVLKNPPVSMIRIP